MGEKLNMWSNEGLLEGFYFSENTESRGGALAGQEEKEKRGSRQRKKNKSAPEKKEGGALFQGKKKIKRHSKEEAYQKRNPLWVGVMGPHDSE